MYRLFSLIAILFSIVIAACTPSANVSNIAPDTYVSDFVSADQEHVLIDVRTPQEFSTGYISGAINIPVDELASRISEIPEGMPVIVYCRSGNRSARAASILNSNNYNEIYDLGGVIQWQQAGYTLQ
jgi:phage shock protein E